MTRKRFEIGSEYSLDAATCFSSIEDNLYNRLQGFQTRYYSSGRGAIRSVLKKIKGKRALLPSYICQSVITAFEQEHYMVDFYNINTDFSIDIEDVKRKCNSENDIFFVMHYYGTLQNQDDLVVIRNLCRLFSITIIEDTTHSMFTKFQTIGDYCVASLRKWFALPDGGVAYSLLQELEGSPLSGEIPYSNIRTAGMFLKELYLNGLGDYNDIYRRLFTKAEKLIDEERGIFSISDFSKVHIKTFDVGKAVKKRKENTKYLHGNINNSLVKSVLKALNIDICPFFYPLYVENRDRFRSYLNQNRIYCPVHWPIENNRLFKYDALRYISEKVISIPIDQRYSIADMEYLCSVINGYYGGNCG